MFKPYTVCEFGVEIAEHETILAAAAHADDLIKADPNALVTIIVSAPPTIPLTRPNGFGRHTDEQGNEYHLWASGWSRGTGRVGDEAPLDADGCPIAYQTLTEAIASPRPS